MTINSELFIFIDVAIYLLFLVSMFLAFKAGLLLELVSFFYTLVCVGLSWILAPIMASSFSLISLPAEYSRLHADTLANTMIWFVIIFAVLKLLYIVIEPLLKFVSKIPFLGFFNKLGGMLFGIINAFLIIVLINFLTYTPVFSNGKEIRENTNLKYVSVVSDKALEFTTEHINMDSLKDKFENFDIETVRKSFKKWLRDEGLLNE